MPDTSFSVKYDGPALSDGRMPVRDLAPALLSLGEAFTEASLTLYPENEPVSLEIKATAEGSFDVDLILHAGASVWDQMSGFGATDAATTLVVLKEFLIGGAADSSLFGLIKWLRGRRVESAEPGPEPGRVRLTVDDDTSLEVPTEVAALYRNARVRKKVREVVQPLRKNGVDGVEFRSEKEVTLVIGGEDLQAFDSVDVESDQLTEHELDLVLEIITPNFKEENKWRFHDGERQFHAAILDADFLARVDAGEPFRKGDRIRARVQVIQYDQDGELRTERRIVEVYEHRAGTEQLNLGVSDATEPRRLPPAGDTG